MVVTVKVTVFQDMMLCSLIKFTGLWHHALDNSNVCVYIL
jgi:hypothetical protein